MSFRPWHGIVIVLLASAGLLVGQYAAEGGFSRSRYERVAPQKDGLVHLDASGIGPEQVRFFQFLNTGNQEVFFFVGRDAGGTIHVAYDANEICFKSMRGYRHEGAFVTCNKCDKSFRIDSVNSGGGGCTPIPLAHRLAGNELLITESDVLAGWRYFH